MKKLIFSAALVSLGLMCSCQKDELVPEGEKPSWLGESIYEELKNPQHLSGTFSTYLRLIDDVGYGEVLARTGSMTVFPANDEAFTRFFQSDNTFGVKSYDELTLPQKKLLLNSSLLKNALLASMLSNVSASSNSVERGQAIKHETNVSVIDDVKEVGMADMPSGNTYWDQYRTFGGINCVYDATVPMMVHLTREQMLNNSITTTGTDCDFGILRGERIGASVANADTAYVFQDKIVNQDIVCLNGYIHQLQDVLVPPGNIAQVLRNQSNTTLFSRMLDYHCAPYEDLTTTNSYNDWARQNNVDTKDMIYQVRYFSTKSQDGASNVVDPAGTSIPANQRLDWDPGWNQYYSSSVASNSLNDMGAIFAPTDEAVRNYFLPGGQGASYVTYFGSGSQSGHLKPNTAENLPEHLDSMFVNGNGLITTIVKNLMKSSFVNSVPSKFGTLTDAGSGDVMNISIDQLAQTGGHYDVHMANNGVLYKMNRLYIPHEYSSVMGPTLTYPGMNIMNYFITDKTTGSASSKFGADMYYYLMAMKSWYAFFSMKDINFSSPVIDPVSLGKSKQVALEYYTYQEPVYNSDGSIGRYTRQYGVRRHDFNKATGEISGNYTEDPRMVDNQGNTSYASQVTDLLNYHTVVLNDGEEFGRNHYYLTKHGGAIYVKDFRQVTDADGKVSYTGTVLGGAQIKYPNLKPSTITEGVKQGDRSRSDVDGNGFAFVVDAPIQPTVTSVYSFLQGDLEEFSAFRNMTDSLQNTQLLSWLGLNPASEDGKTPSQQDNYMTFWSNNGCALDMNVKFFNGYNYTFYAPDNKAMAIAYSQKGLPTMKEIYDLYEGDYEDDAAEAEAKALCLKKVNAVRAFIRYHFQNNSVFADNHVSSMTYQSMYSNDLGIAYNYSVSGGNGVLTVKDAAGQTVSFTAGGHNVNVMARDYIYDKEPANASKITNSSFAVIHQLSTPFCYNKSGRYDDEWR